MTIDADLLRRELQDISRILLIRIRSLGDAILTLPLIEALHEWQPQLKQSILIEAPHDAVFLHHPAVAETLVLQTPNSRQAGWTRRQAIAELRKRRYPAVVNLHGGTTSMLFTIASGAHLRVGQEAHRGSWLYNRRVPTPASIWRRHSLHTVENQLSLVRWLGLPVPLRPFTLHLSEPARMRIQQRLEAAGITEFALVQPTATLPTKQWEPAKFAQLGDWLTVHHHLPVIYTAAPHETAILNQIDRTARERHTCLSDLPLMELFALIERCRLFVGCDSGPTHAAAALKKPIVVVWGSSNFQAWHPWETAYEAVRSDLPCIPCPGYECKVFGEPKCIMEIPVSRVQEACTKILSGRET